MLYFNKGGFMKNYLSLVYLIIIAIILCLAFINPFWKIVSKAVDNIEECNKVYYSFVK